MWLGWGLLLLFLCEGLVWGLVLGIRGYGDGCADRWLDIGIDGWAFGKRGTRAWWISDRFVLRTILATCNWQTVLGKRWTTVHTTVPIHGFR